MTATPIPRTLTLTLYGDLDVSVIAELPQGRRPIRTFWVEESRRKEIYSLLDRQIQKGGQAYVVCPLIDEKAAADVKSIMDAHRDLSQTLSHRRIGLLHGRMKSEVKKKIMQEFKEKKVDILISTVVIEVGVDVPNATVMIIENAEKFGLAQLHQLRGRVGRGGEESHCILFSEAGLEESVERLKAFESMQSGFDVAEKDLAIRGGGDVLGEKQHGLADLKIGDIVRDFPILQRAKNEARELIAKDPRLLSPANAAVRRAVRERFGLKSMHAATTG